MTFFTSLLCREHYQQRCIGATDQRCASSSGIVFIQSLASWVHCCNAVCYHVALSTAEQPGGAMSHAGPSAAVEFTTFGDFLKYLRRRARLNQRELAIAVNYSTAQISRLEQNQRLPDLATLLALFVPALELSDEPELVARLLELAAAARGEDLTGRTVSFSHDVQRSTTDEPFANSVAPSAPSQPQPPSTLPMPLAPLLGRAEDIRVIGERLLQPEVRLLTLSGPPGVGKTRLSLAVAEHLRDRFADGVCFVALASIDAPDLVIEAIARSVGIAEAVDRPLAERLAEALREQQLLLLLDNFEHLMPAAPLIRGLLAAAPYLKVLLTSRVVLHLAGEYEYSVPPLRLPDLGRLARFDVLAHNPAVALFAQRSQAIDPSFLLSETNVAAVAAICVRLDGLPLAIELAAARIKLLEPQALLARLHRRLPLLTRGPRDLPARQQTLNAAIEWSYDLLAAGEQALFTRLGVFVGGCTLDAAEAICGGRPADAVSPSMESEVLDGLQSLIDASLVQVQQSDSRRLLLLETVREYALDRLAEREDGDAVRHHHALYYLQLAEAAEAEWDGPQKAQLLAQIEREHGNFRAALTWAHARRDASALLRLTGILWKFWDIRGYLSEGRNWMAAALSSVGDEAELLALRAQVAEGAGFLAYHQCDYAAARVRFEESLTLYRALGDTAEIASALNDLGLVAWHLSEYQSAQAFFTESLALYRKVAHRQGTAWVLGNLGIIPYEQGDYAAAGHYYAASLAIHREVGNQQGIAAQLNNLGNVAFDQSDFATARARYEESLALKRELGNNLEIPSTLYNLGTTALAQGDHLAARALFEESLSLHRELGDQVGIAGALIGLGHVACGTADYAAAYRFLAEGLKIAQKTGAKLPVIEAVEGMADLAAAQERFAQAARLFAAAAATRESLGTPISPADQGRHKAFLDRTRAKLNDSAIQSAWEEGQMLTLEQAIAEAMTVTND
jgi:predicted ATPase/transcriptional regulator with XRE-family HTH domain